jgi:4-nitrophenyl phosphatase
LHGRAATIVVVVDLGRVSTVLCDLDGVVWLAHEPIRGSVEAVAALRASGRRVVFVTNNSAATESAHVAALAAVGIPADGDVVSSAMAAAHLVQPGERVLVTAGPGVREALERRGAFAVDNDGANDPVGFAAVVVGLHRSFDYHRLTVAAAAVRAGARLIGTNTDSTYPTPDGLLPGGGALLAAVATASGSEPIIGGKPHHAMADAIADTVSGSAGRFDPATVLMVGDRPETDGLFARRLGCAYALVRSGVTAPGVEIDAVGGRRPEIDAADLAAVTRRVVRGPRGELSGEQ